MVRSGVPRSTGKKHFLIRGVRSCRIHIQAPWTIKVAQQHVSFHAILLLPLFSAYTPCRWHHLYLVPPALDVGRNYMVKSILQAGEQHTQTYPLFCMLVFSFDSNSKHHSILSS